MKDGTRVKINGDSTVYFNDEYGVIDGKSIRSSHGQCYYVKLDNGARRSYSSAYLVEETKAAISFEDVRLAQKQYEEAKAQFLKVLSDYQIQESGK